MMRSCTKKEISAKQILAQWDARATATRKPVESAFSMLKHRFPTLPYGLRSHHEDHAAYVIIACIILLNLNIDFSDTGEEILVPDNECASVEDVEEQERAKRIREALPYYANNQSIATSK